MIQSKAATPYYLFDEQELVERTKVIKEHIGSRSGKTCFAIKANPFLIPSLVDIVDKFEVCSPGELEICRMNHVPGEKILFSGVVKSKDDMRKALEYPVATITLESVLHWEYLKECLEHWEEISECPHRDTVNIMPRLSNGAQFGMPFEDVLNIAKEQKTMPDICFEGLHYFTGTQKKGAKYEKELIFADEKMKELKAELEGEEIILEYGPGLAVPYFTGDSFDNPYELIENLAQFIGDNDFGYRIDIELGRYIAASCGTYHTSVVDLKKADDRYYCLVDGGIHHVNYYGSNMAMRTPIIEHVRGGNSCALDPNNTKRGNADEAETISDDGVAFENLSEDAPIFAGTHEYMICGSLCTFADILVRGAQFTDIKVGDELIFRNIGAYSVTECSYLFLSRRMPGIYIKRMDGQTVQVREGLESYLLNTIKA